ncbi:hypothetical protein JFL47_03980 [Haemophilus haemoglobinophilus]|nr:hypothetical protein [Canicola haemoglobinophilus]
MKLKKLKITIISSFIVLGFWNNSALANNVKEVDGQYIIEIILPQSDRITENRIAPLKAKSELLKKLKSKSQIKSIQLHQFTLVKKEYFNNKVKFTFKIERKNVGLNL